MKAKTQVVLARITVALILIVGISIISFYTYVSDYYEAEDIAITAMTWEQDITSLDGLTIIEPAETSTVGFIFYPGAKVEYIAYLPILEKLAAEGVTCFLVEMPYNLAFFDIDAADDIIAEYTEIETWYVGGHSLGGAMSSVYAEDNQDEISGLILLGSYVYGDYPLENSLTIYGSFNYEEKQDSFDYTENLIIIEGGNHAQFGNYGEQKGDSEATITADEQQTQAVEAIVEFIAK